MTVPTARDNAPVGPAGAAASGPEGVAGPVGASSLDKGTQLVYGLSYWHDAGEVAVYMAPKPQRDRQPSRKPKDGQDTVTPPEELRARSARRARGTVRRYGVANRLTRMVTLTYAPDEEHCVTGWDDPDEHGAAGPVRTTERSEGGSNCSCGRPYGIAGILRVLADAESFVRRLRRSSHFRGRSFPYTVVAELHKDGHAHGHALLGEFVPYEVLRDCWPHGYIDVRKFKSKRGGRDAARTAAGYATKYVGKTFDLEDWPKGAQRYRVAEGFQPRVVRRTYLTGSRHTILRDWLDSLCLTPDVVVWSEDTEESDDAPPWVWAQVSR